jgi:hypothetical protein
VINWKDYLSTADNPVATKMRGGIYACMNQIHANGCMTGFVLGRLGEPVALVWDSYGGHFYGSEDYDLRPISDSKEYDKREKLERKVERLERERDEARSDAETWERVATDRLKQFENGGEVTE